MPMGYFLEQFFVAQYTPLVRFDPACRSGARHSDKWPALSQGAPVSYCEIIPFIHIYNILTIHRIRLYDNVTKRY